MFATKNIIYHFKKQKTVTYVHFKIYILLVSNKGFLFTTKIATASVSINITALLALQIKGINLIIISSATALN